MEKIIYDNYSLYERYEDTKEFLFDEYGEEPTDAEIWDIICSDDALDAEIAMRELKKFFSEGTYIAFGSIGRWNSCRIGWEVFTDFEKEFYKLVKDCDYIKIYEEDNHFFIDCSHHDGNNSYEIKKLTDRGIQYYDNWNYSWNDSRDNQYVGNRLISNYSVLPRFFKIRKEV